jgi:phospholipid-binding lipoprotein MlaA
MFMNAFRTSALLLASLFLLGGCATNGDRRDPLEPLNRGIYQFNEAVDKAAIKPVAQAYKEVLPQPVRTGVANFFSNLDDVLVLLNDLLQFKLEQAASDFSRVVWNTTVGIAGLIDVGSKMDLEKHNEDFGQTLGYWGIGDGPYLMLPILGPSNLRDTAGRVVDWQFDLVTNYYDVPVRNTATVVKVVDTRSRLLQTDKILDEAAIDPYVFMRDAYLQRRRNLVHDGNPPRLKLDEDE